MKKLLVLLVVLGVAFGLATASWAAPCFVTTTPKGIKVKFTAGACAQFETEYGIQVETLNFDIVDDIYEAMEALHPELFPYPTYCNLVVVVKEWHEDAKGRFIWCYGRKAGGCFQGTEQWPFTPQYIYIHLGYLIGPVTVDNWWCDSALVYELNRYFLFANPMDQCFSWEDWEWWREPECGPKFHYQCDEDFGVGIDNCPSCQ